MHNISFNVYVCVCLNSPTSSLAQFSHISLGNLADGEIILHYFIADIAPKTVKPTSILWTEYSNFIT